jgi:hypothetical protein
MPLSLQPEILSRVEGKFFIYPPAMREGHFLKRFDKDPPVGNASRV